MSKLKLNLPAEGLGQEGLLDAVGKILDYSVNTWDQGFLDKLYASNTPVCFSVSVSTANDFILMSIRSESFQTLFSPY